LHNIRFDERHARSCTDNFRIGLDATLQRCKRDLDIDRNDRLQWIRDGADLSGQTAASLVVTQPGSYQVRVTTPAGCALTSGLLSVTTPIPSISPSSQSFGANGGQGSFLLKVQGCSWAASSSADWVTITGPTSGTTDATVSFLVGTNVSATARSAAISVGQSTFTVSQAAAPPFGAPSFLIATFAAGVVNISWEVRAGAARYEIYRATAPGNFNSIGLVTTISIQDSTVVSDACYAYRVRAIDGNGNPGPWSPIDISTTVSFADDPLLPRITTIKLQHLTQIRDAVNIVRRAAGLGSQSFSDPSPTIIKASQLREVRSALETARAAFGIAPFPYRAVISEGATINASDFQETRDALR